MENYEKEHIEALRPYLAGCTVLLKNDRDFRVSKPGKIALFGNGARRTRKGGTGSGEVNSRYFVTCEEGLEQAGFTVTTKAWLDAYAKILPEAKKAFIQRIKREAKALHVMPVLYGMGKVMPEPEYDIPLDGEGELAVYVLGRICGEGSDRENEKGDFRLTDTEVRDILALNKKFDKFLLVLNVGGPVDLTPVLEASNILVLSQLGVETGSVLADLLTGKANPSGKLTTTWASYEDYCQEGSFARWEDTEYKEGIYVGYRYFSTVGKKPLFPFGYGLSFTRFALSDTRVSVNGTSLKVTTTVTNAGGEAGRETVQVYVRKPEGKLCQPARELIGYEKTRLLGAGESQEVTVSVDLKNVAAYSEQDAAYILEAGDMTIFAGTDSNAAPAAILSLAEDVTVKKVKNLLGPVTIKDMTLKQPEAEEENLPRIELDPAAFVTDTVDYDLPENIDEWTKDLTDEELIYLSVGAFNPKGGLASVIGEASSHVAGAAGETSGIAAKKGIRPIIMADGPAGLRLSPNYYKDETGAHTIGANMVDGITEFMPPFVGWFLKVITPKQKKDIVALHQFTTAIPIGTAIAQSFDKNFAFLCGDIVGDEMERMGVDLWLAPALNIHRNVLCGRNFEYYSEDPLVSGNMAAAITNGVQQHAGKGTTIKHFFANNQETNRFYSNSSISERAMRDIYLKGFEICIRDSQPKAVMTSYNLVNGTHTSERRDLNTDILRAEFGYKGLVMTDWVVGSMMNKKEKYPWPEAYKVANSGNDIFMPGSQREIDDLKAALAEGKITRKQLEINVSHILSALK